MRNGIWQLLPKETDGAHHARPYRANIVDECLQLEDITCCDAINLFIRFTEDFVAAQVQLKDKYLRLKAAQEAVSGTLLQLEDKGEEFETDFIDAESYREKYLEYYTRIDKKLGETVISEVPDTLVWTLVPVRLDQQLSDHSTVDEIASGAADYRLTCTMANCPQRRKEERKREREKEGKRARKRQGLVVLGSGEENPRVLFGDADQESETRMSKNALRTGRRQAVELRKGDLLEVARELGVEVNGDQTKVEIKNMILQNDKNDMETTKAVMEGILEEKEREFEERRQTREYELERLRLSNATETVSVSSADLEGQGVNRRVNLKDLVPKFDAKNADINLFFEIFERQAKKENVAEDRWVSQLIPFTSDRNCGDSSERTFEKSDDYPT
ncbi:uncharacterized protein TNCV_4575981 [Trichonephila clavipes]|nr:uncharacterized protein TNCV_4575981 [Trichonephila clavipes]